MPNIVPTNVAIRDTNPADIMERVLLFEGPKVTIVVGTGAAAKEFSLHKALVCYYSKVLNAAFNAGFQESTTLTYSFPENTVAAFQMVIKWMYGGATEVGPRVKAGISMAVASAEIGRAIEFFVLADEMDLVGAQTYTTIVVNEVRDVLRLTNKSSLLGSHIHDAVTKLPCGHRFRRLIAEACVQGYLIHTQPPHIVRFPSFGFEEELGKLEGFASDLLTAIAAATVTRTIDSGGAISCVDPINGTRFYYH